MEGIFIEIGMLRHKCVQIVHENLFGFDEGLCDGISRVDARVGGAVGCFGLDRSDRRPDKFAATGECLDSLKEDRKAGFELRFGVSPAVQAIVEVNYGEGDTLHGGELGNLTGQAGITHRCGGRHEVDIGDAAEIFRYVREIAARDGVAKKKDDAIAPYSLRAEPPEVRTSLHVDLLNEGRLMQNGREHLAQSGVVEKRSSARRSRGRVHKASKRLSYVKLEF
jgi:hypothetical protein